MRVVLRLIRKIHRTFARRLEGRRRNAAADHAMVLYGGDLSFGKNAALDCTIPVDLSFPWRAKEKPPMMAPS
jgi:hypothetical protein